VITAEPGKIFVSQNFLNRSCIVCGGFPEFFNLLHSHNPEPRFLNLGAPLLPASALAPRLTIQLRPGPVFHRGGNLGRLPI
jgi:hypothetical protein